MLLLFDHDDDDSTSAGGINLSLANEASCSQLMDQQAVGFGLVWVEDFVVRVERASEQKAKLLLLLHR